MIKLTRLDGGEILMNENFIEIVNEAPDTVVTMNNGKSYIVRESMDEILDKIARFNRNGQRFSDKFTK